MRESHHWLMWDGNLNVKGRSKLQRLGNLASSQGEETEQISIYIVFTRKCLGKSCWNQTPPHPLNREFEILPSGRWYKVPKGKAVTSLIIPSSLLSLNTMLVFALCAVFAVLLVFMRPKTSFHIVDNKWTNWLEPHSIVCSICLFRCKAFPAGATCAVCILFWCTCS